MDWENEATFLIYKYITDMGDFGELVWGEALELYYADEYTDDDEDRNAMGNLADWLRDRITYDDNPLGSGLYFDLVLSALKDVDWYSIANELLRRIKREERKNNEI